MVLPLLALSPLLVETQASMLWHLSWLEPYSLALRAMMACRVAVRNMPEEPHRHMWQAPRIHMLLYLLPNLSYKWCLHLAPGSSALASP